MQEPSSDKETELKELLRGIEMQIDKIERLIDELPNLNPTDVTPELIEGIIENLHSELLPEITDLCNSIKSYAGSIVELNEGKNILKVFNDITEKASLIVDIAEQLRDLLKKEKKSSLVNELISMFNENVKSLHEFFSDKIHSLLEEIIKLLKKIDSVL